MVFRDSSSLVLAMVSMGSLTLQRQHTAMVLTELSSRGPRNTASPC